MPERKVLTCVYRRRMGEYVPAYEYDYSTLGVGDWFMVTNPPRIRSFNVSRYRDKLAKKMTFKTEMISERTMKVTRTA